jgi:hypothetical protein
MPLSPGNRQSFRNNFGSLQCWRCSDVAVHNTAHHTRTSSAKTRADGALIHYNRVSHRSPPHVVTSGCKPTVIGWIASFARMQSIRQSVQNGQFLCRLAQKASDLSVASHTDKGIERFLVYVVATALAIDQTPTLQLIEPACDRGAGQAHLGSHH